MCDVILKRPNGEAQTEHGCCISIWLGLAMSPSGILTKQSCPIRASSNGLLYVTPKIHHYAVAAEELLVMCSFFSRERRSHPWKRENKKWGAVGKGGRQHDRKAENNLSSSVFFIFLNVSMKRKHGRRWCEISYRLNGLENKIYLARLLQGECCLILFHRTMMDQYLDVEEETTEKETYVISLETFAPSRVVQCWTVVSFKLSEKLDWVWHYLSRCYNNKKWSVIQNNDNRLQRRSPSKTEI